MARYLGHAGTEHASRYLQQLCKHWSHRFKVSFDASRGVIELNGATCTMAVDGSNLSLTLEGDDNANVRRLCDVVAEHLARFAFREQLDVTWLEASSASPW